MTTILSNQMCIFRRSGAVPATVAIIKGRVHVGRPGREAPLWICLFFTYSLTQSGVGSFWAGSSSMICLFFPHSLTSSGVGRVMGEAPLWICLFFTHSAIGVTFNTSFTSKSSFYTKYLLCVVENVLSIFLFVHFFLNICLYGCLFFFLISYLFIASLQSTVFFLLTL